MCEVKQMYCLENMQRISYPADLVMDLTRLYRFKGKDFYYEDVFKSDMQTIIKDTIERDTFYAARVLNLQITEARLRTIIRKDLTPKTTMKKFFLTSRKYSKLFKAREMS